MADRKAKTLDLTKVRLVPTISGIHYEGLSLSSGIVDVWDVSPYDKKPGTELPFKLAKELCEKFPSRVAPIRVLNNGVLVDPFVLAKSIKAAREAKAEPPRAEQ